MNKEIKINRCLQEMIDKYIQPLNVKGYISVERYNKLIDDTNGEVEIKGVQYKIIGENQNCGMIDIRLEIINGN